MNGVAEERIAQARQVKAGKLIGWCRTHGITAEQIAYDDDLRNEIANQVELTGKRAPSKQTWLIALATLHHLEQNPAPADPFEGL